MLRPLLLLLVLLPGLLSAAPHQLTILSTNDLHGELDPYATYIRVNGVDSLIMVGGFARLETEIDLLRRKDSLGTLVVNSGDNMTGRYVALVGPEPIFAALNRLGIDAGTLGNHEFDNGDSALALALAKCRFPMIESDLDIKPRTPLAGRFPETLILERAGLKIGLLGLMTPALANVAKSGDAVSVDTNLVERIRRDVRKLRDQDKVDLVVILSHLGLEADSVVATEVQGIDVISGGHSHHELHRGQECVVRHPDGRMTVITQTGAHAVWLGDLQLTVDDRRIQSYTWDLIKLDTLIRPDPGMDSLLGAYRKGFPPVRVLTTTKTPLDGRGGLVCTRESALGNLICDLLRHRYSTDVAVTNGGGIRGDRVIAPGPVTSEDLATIMPFNNDVVVARIKGSLLKAVLEWSAAQLPDGSGGFLQVSGMRFAIKVGNPGMKLGITEKNRPEKIVEVGDRIHDLEILGKDGAYHPYDPEKEYTMALNSYLAGGGDYYIMMRGLAKQQAQKTSMTKDIIAELESMKVIEPKVEGRIRIE